MAYKYWYRISPVGTQYVKWCCRSGMFIPDPDYYTIRIPDLASWIQQHSHKHKYQKINTNFFSFKQVPYRRKKM
jgi:hypothetical protein